MTERERSKKRRGFRLFSGRKKKGSRNNAAATNIPTQDEASLGSSRLHGTVQSAPSRQGGAAPDRPRHVKYTPKSRRVVEPPADDPRRGRGGGGSGGRSQGRHTVQFNGVPQNRVGAVSTRNFNYNKDDDFDDDDDDIDDDFADQGRVTIQFDPSVPLPTGGEEPRKRPRPSFRVAWLCRTRYFERLCDWAFEDIDTDGSGCVDEKELYSGLLLIHLKLGSYAGPAACKPLDRQKCKTVFEKMDVDNSGSLDKEEFREVMKVLFGNVLMRVMFQWSMTLMIVPLIATYILDLVYFVVQYVWDLISSLDEHSTFLETIETDIREFLNPWIDKISDKLPPKVLEVLDTIKQGLDQIPDVVWDSVPLTLISTVLGLVLVPWCLLKIDDFFQMLADKGSNKIQKKKKR